MPDDDEYDNIPDAFADIDGVDWEQLLSTPVHNDSPPRATVSSDSEAYFDDDDDVLDAHALAELDAIERQAASSSGQVLDRVAGPSAGESYPWTLMPPEYSRRSPNEPADTRACLASGRPSYHDVLKRHRSASTSPCQPSRKKGKMKMVGLDECSTSVALALLEKMEDEYSCPVCCDLLAVAHTANPCGHSFCGECGTRWLAVAPTCPICRTNLSRSTKIIPNIALENAVEKYIEMVGTAGHEGWTVGGSLYKEWNGRKERWKKQSGVREQRPVHTTAARIIDLTAVFDQAFPLDDEALDPSYGEDDGAQRYHPRQVFARTRHYSAFLLTPSFPIPSSPTRLPSTQPPAMQIIFSPALGETVQIPISEARIPSDSIYLHFQANLGREEYTKVEQGSARVQLWSNLPTAHDQPDGSWRELDFEIAKSGGRLPHLPPNGCNTANAVRWLSLANLDEDHQPASVGELVLRVRVDLSTFVGERGFAFTYRVLHSDSSITWLGSHGHNGAIVLKSTRMLEGNLEEAPSEVGAHGFAFSLPNSPPGWGITNISNLGDYQLWALDRNLHLYSSTSISISDAQLLIGFPRKQRSIQYSGEPAYVLSASQGATLSASLATGEVLGVGPGTVLFQSCYNIFRHLGSLVQTALVFSGVAEKVRLVCPDNKEWLLLLTPRDRPPTKGLLIPTQNLGGAAHARVDIGVASLAEIMSPPLKGVPPQFCVFSPLTYDLEFIDTSPELDSATNAGVNPVVAFCVPSGGGEFTLSKVYDLTGEESCKISLLSPYGSVSQGGTRAPVVLPTPPPSPLLLQRHRGAPPQPVVTFSPKLTFIPYPETDDLGQGELVDEKSDGLGPHGQRAGRPSLRTKGVSGLIKYLYSMAIYYLVMLLYLLLLGPLRRRGFSIIGGGVKKVDDAVEGKELGDPGEGKVETETTPSEEEEDVPALVASVDEAVFSRSPPSEEQTLLTAELVPHFGQEIGGKAWAKLAVLTTSAHKERYGPAISFGPLPLSNIRKRITLNGNVPEQMVARFLRDSEEESEKTYYSVEFPVSTSRSQVPVLKIVDCDAC